MRIINTSVCAFQNKVLVIGFEGENERTQVRIDASEVFTEYPHATPSLTVKPNSGEAYPATVNRDGTDVVWDITSSYLTERGEREIQLTFIKDSVVCKSYIGKALVLRSLTVEGEMPTPVESWVDAANAKLAEVDAQIVELEGMVDTATDAATRAEQSASTASTKAEQAAGSAATASTKAAEAQASANTATAKASEAALSATQARNSAMSAADSERGAIQKAAEAAQSAQTATTKAEQATEAAQTATEKAGDASASARAAQTSATNAASSATAASASETAAKASETAASTSATQAAQSVLDAGANAQTAMQKATEASQSATNAATYATNAETSAETASTKAGEAAQSAQAVEETAEQLADSLEQISQNTADIAEHEQAYNALKAATLIHSTASGAIASFPDGAEMPVDEVTAQINPVQDLHGYDSPWPAGGGTNRFNEDTELGAIGSNGVPYATTDSIRSKTFSACEGSTSYYIGEQVAVYFYDSSETFIEVQYANNNVKTSPANAAYFKLGFHASYGTAYKYDVAVNYPSSVTTYSPYSNICPISGFEGLTVTRTGKNLFNKEKLVHGQTAATLRYGAYGQDKYNSNTPNRDCFLFAGDYTFSLNGANSTVAETLAVYDETGTRLKLVYNNKIISFTVPVDGYVRIIFTISTKNFVSWDNYDIQLERGTATATDYEPYQGTTLPISWQSSAGTVYGGTATVQEDGTVQLVATWTGLSFDGTQTVGLANWQMYDNSSGWLYRPEVTPGLANVIGAAENVKSDTLKSITYDGQTGGIYGNNIGISLVGSSSYGLAMRVPVAGLTTTSLVNAYLAENPIFVLYKLETPVSYTLPSVTALRTLLGVNNFWHDANGDISVGYKANTKLYIDNKIAELVARIVNS